MGSKKNTKQQQEDFYGEMAGAIGGLVIITGILGAIKIKLRLNWPVTILLVVGVLVGIGYGIFKARAALQRCWSGQSTPATQLKQKAPSQGGAAAETAVESVPAHPELTAALRTAGAIGRDEIIRADEVTVSPVPTGKQYDFVLPAARTYRDVESRLENVAGYLHKTRLHLRTDRSRDSERRIRLLVLEEEPFSTAFPPPTREQIKAFKGVPLGHDVTGQLVGVRTFSKASMLVGGMSQMGKSTLINGLIACLLIAYGDLDLYLLDGKLCALIKYEKACVRYEASDDPAVFESMLDELNQRVTERYAQKQEALRNRQPEPKFRPVIFIADEVADFFADDSTPKGKERAQRIEEKARKLTAKSLESEISTIFLTQRPDKDAIPVKVRSQFNYRISLYVESAGTARVILGDSYFSTVAPIDPTQLNPEIKGQGVLFAGGRSTLIRGFNFPDEFMWEVADEAQERLQRKIEASPETPLKQAISLMRKNGVDFMRSQDLAQALDITATDATDAGKQLSKLLGVSVHRGTKGVRGYRLADLTAAAMPDS
ncbi:FtsK/SpoIIIE domain-containing protein [Streptomyces sp. NPDC049915]|uniref:FtsK/SpoIIIE domain-containing protein n=1 Tax=Streptomyces sp. NPDC049915 TaxID=3155510 RepID=UPI003425F989